MMTRIKSRVKWSQTMTKAHAKLKSPFVGLWHTISMSAWEDDYINQEVKAYIEFNAGNGGSFQFGYVQGQIDCRTTNRGGKPAIEFTWEGGDEADGTPLTGRGWTILGDRELNGMIYIHSGDESVLVARRAKARISAKRKKHED
jgi:hypothetical protein